MKIKMKKILSHKPDMRDIIAHRTVKITHIILDIIVHACLGSQTENLQ